VRILAVQETDWVERNPILHHRMLESLALAGDEVRVLDYEILWRHKGRRPLLQRRREITDTTKFFPGSGVVVVRPAMLRVPGLARPTWLIATTVELLRAFRTFKPDVVVAYGLSNALVARALARLYGVPFVFHIFDALHAIAEPEFLAPVARVVEQAVLRTADSVIVVHRGMVDYVRRMGAAPSLTTFIMNGFTVRQSDPERLESVRRSLGVADDEVMLLFVGWMYTFSGLRELARKLVASDRYARYRLVIAGDGDLFPELKDLSQRSSRGDRLALLGKVPRVQIADLIGAADVGLCSSNQTPAMRYVVPSKVDEYLELGRPVVATRLPGLLAELGAVESMVWVDGPEETLDALDSLLADQPDPRSHLRALGASARAYGQQRETWETVTARFRAVLADTVSAYSSAEGRHRG
jgi:glycosyltransferase involved in cell wall biosynthesis